MKNSSNPIFQMILVLFIISGVAISVIFLFQSTKTESEVVISENEVKIVGQYGTTMKIDDISDAKLVETMPSIRKKVNGAGLGEIKKGDYDVEGIGTCRLFLHSNEGPFVYIIVNDKHTIINFEDESKTVSVYVELKEVLSKQG